jgi:hypothetical protein
VPGEPSEPSSASATGKPTRAVDAEPLGRLGAEHHHRVVGGRRVQEPAGGDRPAEGVEQVRVGGEHADAAGLGLRDLVAAAHGGVDRPGGRHPPHRPDPADHAGGLLGELGVLAQEALARAGGE